MFGAVRKIEEQPVPTAAAAAPVQSYAARRELLHRLGNFLLDHELEVNPANLAVAQEAVSGNNAELNRLIAARQLANEPITQAWLDDVASESTQVGHNRAEAREREALDWLTGKLEQTLEQILQNAGAAGAETAQYHAALSEAAAALDAARPIVELPGLTRLTRTMIERTQAVEEEMRRRESEVGDLRETLKLARADAAMDHLTGMDNVRNFDMVLEREHRAALEAGEPLSIAFCDIDRFKAINDTHGRETGDRVIQAIARVLQRISGHSCHVARNSGEEFVLLFHGLTPDQARDKLDNARETFAQRKLVDRKTHVAVGSVTFSGGVADALAYGNAQAALKAADEALLAAKDQGRNRIVVAPKPA